MLVLAGGDLVLPDRILTGASLIIDGGRITVIEPTFRGDVGGATVVDVRECYVVPGFVDVHVHGVEGHDTLDPGEPVAAIASRLPRYGVTAFCPTTVACAPRELRGVLGQVARARAMRPPRSARVLPAHLESNFINPAYSGAQPAECLRVPRFCPWRVRRMRRVESGKRLAFAMANFPGATSSTSSLRRGLTSELSPWLRNCPGASSWCVIWCRPAIGCRSDTQARP